MHKIAIAIAATATMFAAPAFAQDASGEARVEVRGGGVFFEGTDEATVGVAAGYDFNLSDTLFVGAEVSADKILLDGTDVAFGFTGRAGINAGDNAKVFVTGGYTTAIFDFVDGNWHAGAGASFNVSEKVYIKGEYRHYFESDFALGSDAVVAGVGFKF